MTQFSIRKSLESAFAEALAKATGEPQETVTVSPATRPEFGDYQMNGAMSAAKRLGRNPRELAGDIVSALPRLEQIATTEIAGPGFINIRLSDSYLSARSFERLSSGWGDPDTDETKETIVVDYSSPNLAKEMHVGHLRGTIIGDCLVRVLSHLGYRVIRQNHVGDWGTQFGMLLAQMEDLQQGTAQSLSVELSDLETFYRAAKQRFDNDSGFAERARAGVVKLQAGDPHHLRAWSQFITESLRHCQAVYDRLGICLTRDDLRPESFYNKRLHEIINILREKGLLSESDGAQVVFLPQFLGKDGNPQPVIVQKSDGGYLYSTTDLAAVEFRCHTLRASKVLYVVDARQSLHFQQVFEIARLSGLACGDCQLVHVAYGTMMGKDGRPFKTRSGDTIKLVELIDEGIRRAYELVSAKNPQLDEASRNTIARAIGVGSIKYADLSKNRTGDYIFDWDAMLAFDGNTAPYLLYAYTRIKSILKKQEDITPDSSKILITDRLERALVLKILQLPEVLDLVAEDFYPSHLCTYLYDLSVAFMRFYEACPVLKADAPLRASRLALVALTATTLKQGLGLLGLNTLEQM